jgi:hypothetical protein
MAAPEGGLSWYISLGERATGRRAYAIYRAVGHKARIAASTRPWRGYGKSDSPIRAPIACKARNALG